MNDAPSARELTALIEPVLRRFLAQNGGPAPATAEIERIGHSLWRLIERRGLPRPLGTGETGTPGGMSEDEVAPLVAEVISSHEGELLASAVKQLVKTCFYPEFTVCRDSFREPARDGGCRRQELARVRGRISGAHCVDCPHFVALAPAEHAAWLAQEWRVGGADAFRRDQEMFLPEDFRALRLWLRARARHA